MENMSQKASEMLNEIKVAAEMGVAATEPNIHAYPGLCITDIDSGDIEQRIQQSLKFPYGMPIFNGNCAWKVIPAERIEITDEAYVKLESGGMLTSHTCGWKQKFVAGVGYANDYLENIMDPGIGLLFTGATMQNMYQLITSGVLTSGRGKALMKMNEAALVMLLYGIIMPRHAAGHFALASGVALASAAYLFTMCFAF